MPGDLPCYSYQLCTFIDSIWYTRSCHSCLLSSASFRHMCPVLFPHPPLEKHLQQRVAAQTARPRLNTGVLYLPRKSIQATSRSMSSLGNAVGPGGGGPVRDI